MHFLLQHVPTLLFCLMTKESELQSGRRWEAGGKCYIALLTNCCPYLGTLWAKSTVLKREQRREEEDNDSVRPNAHPMFQSAKWTGQIILLTTSQKSGWNSTQQITSNLSEINTDFRSICYSGLRNKTRNAQGSISCKLKTHIHTDMHPTTMFYLKHLNCFHLEHEWTITSDVKCATCHSGAGG